jgi:hypothetical protein
MLITLCSAIKGCYEREAFDELFSSCFPLDPDGMTRKAFDVVIGGSNRILHPCEFLYFLLHVVVVTMPKTILWS